MRIWSIHPKYLDAKGLVALWREALLAKRVLEGKTNGYIHHPQLIRFKMAKKPIDCINQYLSCVYIEAVQRGYNFNKNKVDWNFKWSKLKVTSGQIKYEAEHLLKKLKKRDKKRYKELNRAINLCPHPLFNIVKGKIEKWEKIKH